MKHDNSPSARAVAAMLLARCGVDLHQRGTYDCSADGRRYSVFKGQVTAIWHDQHFKEFPFGTFNTVNAE